MATHRSLNKLEFKAHMSIHNFVEVKEGETHDSNFTRDRFGKNHCLQNEDGTFRIRRSLRKLKVLAWAAVLGPAACGHVWAAELPLTRNTDIKVESGDFDEIYLDEKLNPPEEKFGLSVDESTAIGINEDGDPNMNMRF